MISVAEAQRRILSHVLTCSSTIKHFLDLDHDIAAASLLADRPLPPFHRVAMDGVAIRFSDYKKGQRTFFVQGTQAAGQEPLKIRYTDENRSSTALADQPVFCIEVMTGAVLPTGADTVIRVEDLVIQEGAATIVDSAAVEAWQNIHQLGSDCAQGTELVFPGYPMRGPELGIAASLGQVQVRVARRPRVGIVSTGDELVEVDEKPLPYQIRRSNAYAMRQSLREQGFRDVVLAHFADSREQLYQGLKELLATVDVLILSGGVSMGRFDYVPKVLASLAVREVFHSVRQRPGKPMWFGVSERKQLVFGLPGNPVSSLVGLHRYVLPCLWRSLGEAPARRGQPIYARLTQAFSFRKNLTYFLPVHLQSREDGALYATPHQANGSGDFASLAGTDGFIELPAERDEFAADESFPVWLWRGGF